MKRDGWWFFLGIQSWGVVGVNVREFRKSSVPRSDWKVDWKGTGEPSIH